MACVYVPEPLDFKCILQVITDVRDGNVSAVTARMVLKQIDSGLALFGVPQVGTTVMSQDIESLCRQLEELMPAETDTQAVVTQMGAIQIIALLIQLWKLLEPILNPPAE